ncbi:MAG: efflux RND transporter periplasmic adaptor subunit [Acidobacteria bacterium]|nr:efflux RND transporter periplasmic adaptor subunit [Acidobacteriota bacterium]
MKNQRASLIAIAIVVVAVIVVVAAWNSNRLSAADGSGKAASVRVRRDKLARTLLVSGELVPVRAVRVSVPRFRERNSVPIQAMAAEGSTVKPGDALLQIDNAPLITSLNNEEINLDKAENDLAKKQSELDVQLKDLELELSTRKLELEKAQLKAEIDKELISLRDWQDNQFNFERTKKEFDQTTNKLALIRKAAAEELALFQIKRDQSQAKIKSMQSDLAALQVKAPVAGTVVYENAPTTWNKNENDPPRKFQVGDQVSPGQIVMSVVDLDEMEVRAFVSEVDGGLLHAGQRARIVVDSHAQAEFTGAVEYVPEVAERLRRLSNVRVFIACLKLDRTDPQVMKPGLSVRAEITLDEQEGLTLPRGAVLEEAGRFYVRHAAHGKTEIKLISRNATSCLIEGLQEGDEIVAAH